MPSNMHIVENISVSFVFRKACGEGDNAEACHRYSALFINGIENVCEKNMSVAFKYSLKVSLEQSYLV